MLRGHHGRGPPIRGHDQPVVLERAESPATSLRLATRTRAGTGGYTELRRKAEGRLVTGPRLLIRKSLVRDQPGEPTTSASSATRPRSRRALALTLWWGSVLVRPSRRLTAVRRGSRRR